MDGTNRSATVDVADRRRAHVRVGAVATAAFLALLLLGATHGPAPADPLTEPAATPTVQPTQPGQSAPADPDPDFGHDHDGFGPRGDGPGFGGGDGDGGTPGGGGGGGAPGGSAPAPSTGGSQT